MANEVAFIGDKEENSQTSLIFKEPFFVSKSEVIGELFEFLKCTQINLTFLY